MLSHKNVSILILVICFCIACEKDNNDHQSTFIIEKIEGVSQKGPFIIGSSLTVYEIDEFFNQTGKSFNTQIKDNLGSFELNNITLLTNYARFKADGFYYNEIVNSNSSASITLYAISDLTNKTLVNVNLLTSLEISRVEYHG